MGAEDEKKEPEFSKNDYDVTEHLMSAAEVASKYATDINVESPSKSGGLKSSEVCFSTFPPACVRCRNADLGPDAGNKAIGRERSKQTVAAQR